ncbi:hemin-binding protein [Bartonella henselae]|uniref:Porin n=2 Tax=Bartonella TaxID=773 RepID=X5M5Z4_BARHN|nr:outer membrane protein [Bartonella henselae]MDM9996166.1 porin family protein [Bartonella henselae]OLL48033.1 hemin-binding protein [Bartonella henselae]OLL48268.1 hemin-binding protein [Bartonella henselae]OLL51840.1 hemin-binding protein [Bartonella henselae]OLL57560.1 hemin-binding protein [Bartonella henselae]
MNTKRLITVSIWALIAASTAHAADVGIPRQSVLAASPVITAPTFTWTGFYAGIQAGGFSSKTDLSIVGKDKTVPLSKDLSPKLSGFEGGFYAGSNINLGDDFIFGVDTDLTLSGQKHTKTIIIGVDDNAVVENAVARSRRSERSVSGTPSVSAPAIAAKPAISEVVNTSTHTHGHSSGHGSDGHNKHHSAGNGAHPHVMGAHSYVANPHASNPHDTQNMAGRTAQGTKVAEKNASGVYGIEQVKREVSEYGLNQYGNVETLSHTLKQNWAGATRVRVGFSVDRVMPYFAGGIAYTQLHDTISISIKKNDESVVASKNLTDEKKTMIGYTLGGGVDFAMTDNILLRAEYRYSDFGKKKFAKEKLEINYKTNDFRVGVAYKF